MAKETQLWNWLRDLRFTMGIAADLRRVEDMTGAGFPDVDGFARWDAAGDTLAFKLELKSHVRPARAATPIRFPLEKRHAQILFLARRYALGEAAYFFLQVGEGADRRLYLAPGDAGDALREGLNESELAVLCATAGKGLVFPKGVKQMEIIQGVRTCNTRRFFP